MANEKEWRGGRLGRFHLGRRYRNVGGSLGRIYEAHNVHTGGPALVLIPGPGAHWEFERSWQVRVSSEVTPPHVAMEMLQFPGSGRLPELAEMLDLLTSALEQVESRDEAREHLMRAPVGLWTRWLGRARRLLRSRHGLTLAGLSVLVLGAALWLGVSGVPQLLRDKERASSAETMAGLTGADEAPILASGHILGATPIAYPLPQKPFSNQAKAPCIAERGEEEIHGGCWVELARRPPCHKDHAEYQGKCYLPISKDRGPREPQSVQP